jgi:cell division protein FtsB
MLAAGVLALADGEQGIPRWISLDRDLAEVRGRIADLESVRASREAEKKGLRDDPLAIEAAIRKDLHRARPGELIVRLR